MRDEVLRALLEHAAAGLPNEACGLVSGRDGRGERFHPARNALASPYRFDLDPADLVRILHDIEASGEDLVAIFHSHPRSVPAPSATDVREARYPGLLHLIVGRGGPDGSTEPRAWRIDEDECTEVPLRVVAPISSQSPR
jgi:[CysO sulfur-carrier protein]-S-L-cysteine hydrolase